MEVACFNLQASPLLQESRIADTSSGSSTGDGVGCHEEEAR